ncbi:MAG TPA: AAA family ATPase [Pirellulaceae bacterium]|nr:AAA family ATPase [Pirellulaceae bacterium]HMO93935.1 AAA family ATPase [Pirellulaceae bacterium]HMP69754.1 AAA family ATPase [Pirellulaceae bacterium]
MIACVTPSAGHLEHHAARGPSLLQDLQNHHIETVNQSRHLFRAMGDVCRTAVQGRDEVIALVLTALFADGHVLLEDHPGSGKTTLAKSLGNVVERPADSAIAAFRRIQFTPDLLPSDITGVTLFDPQSRKFDFRRGPVFANIVLGDEINRSSPKVQSALLEVMAEKQVTVDNETHRLEDLFFVLATQNPLDLAGTYPLPRAQLDRFLFKIKMTHLTRDAELAVLCRWNVDRTKPADFCVAPHAILGARRVVREQVQVPQIVLECLTDTAEALRRDSNVRLGVSTRALVSAIPALQVWAMLHGRDFVSPRDLQALCVPLFGHRIEPAAGTDADAIVMRCTSAVVEDVTRRSIAG